MDMEKIKRYPGITVLIKDTLKKIDALDKEISLLERSRTREKLLTLKKERMENSEKLLEKLETERLELESVIEKVRNRLTPLEYIIISKLYVEGKRWRDVMTELQVNPEYAQFCYARSTYMRAHRSAMDKIMEAE